MPASVHACHIVLNFSNLIHLRPKKNIQLFLRPFLEKTDEAGRFFFFFFPTKKQMRPLFFFWHLENIRKKIIFLILLKK